MHRKETAWKKSRKFGDIKGGRMRVKLSDNIFYRLHSIERPHEGQELPIILDDNPSRDFFFPISASEVCEAMKALPKHDHEDITHIWCRRIKKDDYEKGHHPLAEFICGSGVRVIVLYPWAKDMKLSYGKVKPDNATINEAKKYGAEVKKDGQNWISVWELAALRKYYINVLLYHEIGHHIDWYYRHWSKANGRKQEDYADQYAIQKTATAIHVFDNLQKNIDD